MKYLFSLLMVTLIFTFISCSDETNNTINKPVACITVDDCTSGLLCVDGFCKKEVEDDKCTGNEDCPVGYECLDSGECIEKTCVSKDDCGLGFICESDKCIVGCSSSEDCAVGEKCDFEAKKCKEDNPDDDCRINPGICEQGFECDQINGNCKVSTSCNTDEDCPADSKCEEHNCIPRTSCSSNDECQAPEICREDGFCGPDNGCEDDNYCINLDTTKPGCNVASGVCYECTTDEHCEADKECDTDRNLCVEAGSTTCVSDEDCGLNRKCELDGTCVSMFGAECTTNADCTDLNKGKCLTEADPKRCVQCLQDDQCEEAQICNINTHLCEDMGSGVGCTTDEDCNILAGESCVSGQCYNPEGSGNDGVVGFCDEEYGGSLCWLLGGSCSGDAVDCLISTGDLMCGDCEF